MGRDAYSDRNLVEKSLYLTTKDLKNVIKNPNTTSTFSWRQRAEKVSIMYKPEDDNLVFYYHLPSRYEPVKKHVEIIRQPCNYGNDRLYFACPYCEAKVYTLYKPYPEASFACRKCHDLTYRKQKKHNKTDNRYRWNWVGMEADKLIAEGKTRTIKQRRKINKLRAKSNKLFQKYLPDINKNLERLNIFVNKFSK